ncbi:dUTP diphosphatase [Staphylococcus hominis]|uniref:dUTP diphosphatase n=1 Tax=Staphylococcus hominis TaxID=1290 RepID=UPI00119E9871|nr:dUTP diphosphatase [Staphylococcus hominis]MCI2907746.1 dUTPase [Staphylococcus hominis]
MTNTLTVDQLQNLLQIQKEFDDRIPTLNLQDSKIAYVVEFFEWFNTLETFKNWKKKPGKPLDVQLDELSDMLAFGLSIANQLDISDKEYTNIIEMIENGFNSSKSAKGYMEDICSDVYHAWSILEDYVSLPIGLGKQFYTIDQLIDAYKKKMKRNHARQDGTADKDKGYV